MNNYKNITVEKKERRTIITINRPEVLNAIDPPTIAELDRALNEFSFDDSAWICILTGAGERAFSVGNDLGYTAKYGAEAVATAIEQADGGFAGIVERFGCYKPIIGAINGLALGGGFEIALACDILIASDTAQFGLPEPRVGLIAGAGGLHRLPRQLPYRKAMGLILASRRINAREALDLGLINEVVPPEDLMSVAEKWTDEILEGAPLAIRASKEIVVNGLKYPLPDAMAKEYSGIDELRNSEDLIEGPKAFAEKRKPQWKGR